MKLKYIILSAVMLAGTFCAYAQEDSESPLWLRYSAISPDGSTIAFTYKGDIFTVPVGGGEARQITSNVAFDTRPVWSPDGSRIAFASYRTGGGDIYIVDRRGGEPKRLTTHSAKELPIVFRDNNTILYSAAIQPSAESMEFPGGAQVYAVSTEGGRPKMFSTLTLENIVFSPDGKTILYTDKKGYECEWRKHHTSSVTRDIWSCSFEGDNVKDGVFTKLSAFNGEDRNPVFTSDGSAFYYLSEQDGSFNVWKRSLAGGDDRQITDFDMNPVRFLSISKNGTLCFGYDGEIYTLEEGGQPEKVNIEILADKQDKDLLKGAVYTASGDIAVSKDGKQIAFTYRGDVYVTSDKYATTKRITNTSVQERNVDFAPDGRSIIYSSERDGLWQIYMTSIVNDDEKLFPYATELKEERITNSDAVSFQPSFSPDGKEIAFLENRTAIRVINLESKEVRTVMDGKYQYSYSDGDQWYQWSPDGKWILSNSIFVGGWNNQDVALIDASGNGVMHNLTNSGYTDGSAKWVLDGKAMIWYSDRAGYRSHGSWGAHGDVYIMFFDQEAYKKFNMDEEQLALYEEAEKAKKEAEEKEKSEKDKKKDKKSKDEDAKEEKAVEQLKLDLENAEYRVARLTVNSSRLSDAVLSKDGSKLYYLASFEGGMDLWMHDLKKYETKILAKGVGSGALILSDDGKSIYMNSSGIKKIDVNSGAITSIGVEGEFEYRPYEEREYMFEHAWKQVEDKFYDPTIHGIDWAGYRDVYAKYLPYITNNFDFAEMLSELLGELNASHTGARYFGGWAQYPTASLGIFYDDTYEGDGLKVKEVIKRSPLYEVTEDVVPGCIIESIDGEKISAGKDFYHLLEGKVDKRIRLSVYNPETKARFDVVIEGMDTGYESALLYDRWVERNREYVDSISGGKIGYVHIEGMDSPSFRNLYSELLGRHRHKDAVVVDTRHNGGGWLHDDVVTLLSGKEYQQFAPRGQYVGSDPFNKWLKPSCMLVCEDNYSNAHGTPWVYKHLGIGKLVGAPVPGTMTAVWWETQMDGSIVFGIPQVGVRDLEGNYMENVQLDPDILIYNEPSDVINGFDAQLEAAAEHLMNIETNNN